MSVTVIRDMLIIIMSSATVIGVRRYNYKYHWHCYSGYVMIIIVILVGTMIHDTPCDYISYLIRADFTGSHRY